MRSRRVRRCDRGRARDVDGSVADGARRRRAKQPLDPAWVSHCIDRAKDPRCIVVNEYTLFPEHCSFESSGSVFRIELRVGPGLGRRRGARRQARTAATARSWPSLGDGAYMFSNPAAVHHASALHDLPVLFVVMNNAMWGAVQRSTLAMYPEGLASRSNEANFVQLGELPAFEHICECRRRLRRTRRRSGSASRSA